MALSVDLRRRIIGAWQKQKLTTKELAELFDVGEASVTRLKRLYRDTKSVDPRPHGGGNPPRIPKDKEHLVKKLVLEHPDWTEKQYAEELAERYGLAASSVTVGRVVRKLGYSVKKRPWSRANAIEQTSSNEDASTSNERRRSPLRVWFLWTKPARTSR